MGQFSRTFRIFVSSTFSDLVAERNALQLRVFPRLRELCQQHGCRFQAIDLRWGVSEEASLDQQTMNICLGEISRCQKTTPKPNFIVLLGNRYGWRPLPSEISAKEFVHISSSVSSEDNQMLERWYRRDENFVPPTYSLQSRTGEFYNRKNWEKVENHLHAILESAARQVDLDPDEFLKYTTSATEQEIMMGALRVADAQDHVFCYFREIDDLPQHECTVNYIDLDSAGKLDDNASHLLVELKNRLKTYLPLNTHTYKAKWIDNSPSTEHLEQLCEDVYRDLSKIVLDEIAQFGKVNQLDREIAAHDAFCQERVRHFFGRVNVLKSIADHLRSGDHYSQVVWGESGCGKSALMAQAALQTRQSWPNAKLIFRFIGATPESSNGRALLASLCHQISQAYGAEESSIPFEYKKLVEEFPKRLALATKTKPLILFIDALDQLSSTDNAHNLNWLPVQMPANVKVVLSTLPGEGLQVLTGKLPGRKIIEMTGLSAAEGQAILHAWLKETNRALRPVQKQYFLARFSQCGLPLYLKLAFEEARHWKSYDVNTSLPTDIPGMIRKLFERLSQESNHGEMLVEHSLGYLASAKNGLSEDELLDILSMDNEIISDFLRRSPKSPRVDRLPVVIWSRLYFDLEPYLADREADGSTLFSFYHRQLTEVVQEEYLSDDRKFSRHRSLAQYFQQQELFLQKGDNPVYNLRKLSELPYNLACSGSGEALSKTLSEYIFVEAKVNGIGIQSLIDDYDLAYTSQAKVNPETQKRLGMLQRTMRLSAHVLAGDPRQLPSQLTGRLFGISKSYVKAFLEDARREVTWPWLRPLNVSLETPGSALLRTFSIHSDEVNDVALTPDGHMAISAAGKTLVVWDVTEGKELRTLSGHTDKVDAVALTPDGQFAISASGKTLVVWDVTESKQLSILSGHTDKVNEVALTPDGRLAVSASKDKTLRVWDLENEICLRTLAKHEKCVNTVALTPDGELAISGSDDETLKVWRVASGRVVRTLVTPKKHGVYTEPRPVTTVALTPDGRLAVSGSKFKSLKVWDVVTGVELHSLVGNAEYITDVAVTHDGRLAVSASKDGSLTVWDVLKGEKISDLSGHIEEVNAVALAADGHLAVSASKDKTLKVWDTTDERSEDFGNVIKLVTLTGHYDKVEAVAFTLDGTLAISGSSDTNLK
ncbi:MAG: DUF4062 domain-containing protein, partial [Anaerolineaceae bacterium]|nr:DUF4062 domain-containing protein [Anaerolineaceae bacterium]